MSLYNLSLIFLFQVLLHLDRQEIPKFNIMRRWTKEAVVFKAHGEQTDIASDADQMRKKALMLQTLQIVYGPSPVDEQMFKNAMEALMPCCRSKPTSEQRQATRRAGRLPGRWQALLL